MGLNHKHLTYNKANIEQLCQVILVLWILAFASVNIIASDP